MKAQNFNLFWRKVIVFGVLGLLAVLMFVFISHNFKQRVAHVGQTGLQKSSQPPFSQELGQSLNNLKGFLEEAATSSASSSSN